MLGEPVQQLCAHTTDHMLGHGGFDLASFQISGIMLIDMTRAASHIPALAPQTSLSRQDPVFTGSSLSDYGIGRGSVLPIKYLTSVYQFSS